MKNTKIQHIIQRYLNEQHLFDRDSRTMDGMGVEGRAFRAGWDFRIVGEKNIISNFRADVVDRRAVENGAVAGFLVVATTKKQQTWGGYEIASRSNREPVQFVFSDLFASIADLVKQSNVIKQYYDSTKYQFEVSSPIVNRESKKTFNVWIVDISANSAYGQLLSIIKRLYKKDPASISDYSFSDPMKAIHLKQSLIINQKAAIFRTRILKQFIETLKQKSPELYNQVFPSGSRTKKILSSIPNFEELDKQFEDLPPDIKTGQLVDLNDESWFETGGFTGKGRYDIDPVTGLVRIVPISGKIGLHLYDSFTKRYVDFIGQIEDGLPVSGIIDFDIESKRSKFDGTLNAQRNEKGELEAWFESGKLYLRNETDEEFAYFESSTTNGFSKQGDTLNGTWWERKSPADPYEKVGIEINGKYRAAKQLTYPYTHIGYTYYTTTQSPSHIYLYDDVDKMWDRYDKNKFENFINVGSGISVDDRIIETDPEILADLDRQASTTSKKPLEIKDGLTKINLFKKQGNEFKSIATYTINPPSDTKYLPDANGRSGNYVSAWFKNNNKYIDLWIQKTDLK